MMTDPITMITDQELHKFEHKYGVEFTPPNREMLDGFQQVCSNVEARFLSLIEKGSEIAEDSRVISLPLPPGFLLSSPNPAQRQAIDSGETGESAEIAVKMQASLAKVPIVENFERLVSIDEAFKLRHQVASFSQKPFHDACGEWGGKSRVFWVREQFGHRLALLSDVLRAAEVTIHFEDAFRPTGVQEGLYRRRVDWARADHPDWTEDQILTEARSKTASSPRLASHKAGAAVDLRLSKNGLLLDIGHNYPDGGALVFARTPFVTQEQWQNRMLLEFAANIVGLRMYIGEDWHVNFGDNLASLDDDLNPKPSYIAKYGPIKNFDPQTGEITEVYDLEELDQAFSL